MNVKCNLIKILAELKYYTDKIDDSMLERYLEEIASAKKIYTAGAGRSGLVLKTFAMRLMHLGKEVYVLGDVTVPKAGAGDLLLIGSGSGETKSLLAAGNKAKSCGMKIALNTIDDRSSLAKIADVVIVLPGASPKVRTIEKNADSTQPMGSMFEQLSLLIYDSIIMSLMEKLGQTNDDMFARHANIE